MGYIMYNKMNKLDLRRSGYLYIVNNTSSYSAYGKSDSGK